MPQTKQPVAKQTGYIGNEAKEQAYRSVFGEEGRRSKAQERVWREIVMQPILETSNTTEKNPRLARDLSIAIYNAVK